MKSFDRIKELEKEIEVMLDDDNTIRDYERTLKEIEEKFKSKSRKDLQTGMFILLKVAKLQTLKEIKKEVIEKIEEDSSKNYSVPKSIDLFKKKLIKSLGGGE